MIANILLGLNLYEYKEWWYETNPDYEFLVISEKEEDVLMHYNPIENEAEKFELKEIGDELNITRERVRQIEKKAITKLKSHFHDFFK